MSNIFANPVLSATQLRTGELSIDVVRRQLAMYADMRLCGGIADGIPKFKPSDVDYDLATIERVVSAVYYKDMNEVTSLADLMLTVLENAVADVRTEIVLRRRNAGPGSGVVATHLMLDIEDRKYKFMFSAELAVYPLRDEPHEPSDPARESDRELCLHQVNAVNKQIHIKSIGGGTSEYEIVFVGRKGGECLWDELCLKFQEGAEKDVGVNGLTNEALLAILIDRLQHSSHTQALEKLQEARLWLCKSAIDRSTRKDLP